MMKLTRAIFLGILVMGLLLTFVACEPSEGGESVTEEITDTELVLRPCTDRDGYTVCGYAGDDPHVTIPARHNGKPVVAIESLSSVGGVALVTVQIPASVERIDRDAFSGCTGLRILAEPAALPSGWEDAVRAAGLPVILDCVAHGETESRFLWARTSDGAVTLLAYRGSAVAMSIPESIEGHTVKAIAAGAFAGHTAIDRIMIPASVERAEAGAFSDCTGLLLLCEAASLPSGWEEGWNPSGLPTYFSCRSYGWDKDGLNWILTTEDTVTVIGCRGEGTELAIPDRINGHPVTAIAEGAFAGNTALEQITIPKSVERVGKDAFAGCTKLLILCKVTSLPAGFESGWNPSGCPVLLGGIAHGVTADGIRWMLAAGGTVTVVGYRGGATELSLPDVIDGYPVRRIGGGAFSGQTGLCRLLIPESVVSVAADAFVGCEGLHILTPHKTLPAGWEAGFCPADAELHLNSVAYGESADGLLWTQSAAGALTLIGYRGEATELSLPEEIAGYPVQGIASGAFSGHTEMVEILIPASVVSVAADAIVGRAGLRILTPHKTLPTGWEAGFCSADAVLYLDSVSYGESANGFSWTKSAANTATLVGYRGEAAEPMIPIEIDGCPVTRIASGTFSGHTEMIRILIPASVEEIGRDAFVGCAGLLILAPHTTRPSGWEEGFCPADAVLCLDSVVYGESDDGLMWTQSAVNTVTLVGYRGTATELVIPEVIGGYPVTAIGERAFARRTTLRSVTVPSSVKRIGKGAFLQCTTLSHLTLPFVGESEGGTHGSHFGYIFGADSNFSNPRFVPESLTELVLLDGAVRIDAFAFDDCHALDAIVIPGSVTSIGANAFMGCDSLRAFCRAPQKPFGWVEEPGSAKYPAVYDYAERGMTADGFAFVRTSSDTVVIFGYEGSAETLEIPASIAGYPVVAINPSAFRRCGTLRSLSFEAGSACRSIGRSAFYGASALEAITLPASVESIGEDAFGACLALRDVRFAEGSRCTEIGKNSFFGCSALQSLVLPSSLLRIGDHAFSGCTALSSLEIPPSVLTLGKEILYRCQGATAYTSLAEPPAGWHSEWSAGCPVVWGYPSNEVASDGRIYVMLGGVRYSLKDGVALVARQPNAAESVSIPPAVSYKGSEYAVTLIVDRAFAECSLLREVTLPTTVQWIGEAVFRGCTSLSSVTVPASVTYIGRSAFSDCQSLTEVIFAEGSRCTAIREYAFADCTSLLSFTVPAAVTRIERNAFESSALVTLSFLDPDTWYTTSVSADFEGMTNGTRMNVADPRANAKKMTSGLYWYKK